MSDQYPQPHGWQRTLAPLPGGHTAYMRKRRTKKGLKKRPGDTQLCFPNQASGAAKRLFGASRGGASTAGSVLLDLCVFKKEIKPSVFGGPRTCPGGPAAPLREGRTSLLQFLTGSSRSTRCSRNRDVPRAWTWEESQAASQREMLLTCWKFSFSECQTRAGAVSPSRQSPIATALLQLHTTKTAGLLMSCLC